MTPDRRIAPFASAARTFARQVADIADDQWDGPGLVEWDLRSLVGHTSRSLITVSTYLQTTAEREDIATPEEYYVRVNASVHSLDIARAADLSFSLPEDVLADAAVLATRVGVVMGQGEAVLLALTGRAELPPSFSVV